MLLLLLAYYELLSRSKIAFLERRRRNDICHHLSITVSLLSLLFSIGCTKKKLLLSSSSPSNQLLSSLEPSSSEIAADAAAAAAAAANIAAAAAVFCVKVK